MKPNNSKKHNEHYTPPEFVAVVRQRFDLTLDAACTSVNAVAPRGIYYDRGRDGLEESWYTQSRGGWVWVNPPYNPAGTLRAWMAKVWLERNAGTRVVALVPAYPSEGWWWDLVHGAPLGASEVLCLRGRMSFHGPNRPRGQNARFASALLVYDDRPLRGELPLVTGWDWRAGWGAVLATDAQRRDALAAAVDGLRAA